MIIVNKKIKFNSEKKFLNRDFKIISKAFKLISKFYCENKCLYSKKNIDWSLLKKLFFSLYLNGFNNLQIVKSKFIFKFNLINYLHISI